jgi:outer membrane lipoprotein-sorting protein
MSNVNGILRSFLLILLLAFLITCALVIAAEPISAAGATGTAAVPDARDLLKRSDAYRNGWPSFVTHVKITNYESGKPDEEKLYEVSQKGTDRTYVEFMSPREKGRHLLMLGDDMWVYLPDTSRPVRITPLERLSGDASNGDVARTNYAVDYTPVFLRSEKSGTDECYVLELTARRKGATYQRIVYWVRAGDARPLRAEFYLTSGKHIKSATFDDYEQIGGKVLLRRFTLYDEIRHNSHSLLEYSQTSPRQLPDKLFYQGRADRF